MVGGFMGVGPPERMIGETVRQGKKDLTVIANEAASPTGGISDADHVVPVDLSRAIALPAVAPLVQRRRRTR